MKTLNLKSDIVFKSFMLSNATNPFKAKLINLITGIPIEDLENATYTSQELRSSQMHEKVFKTDIIVTIDSHIISIEMNKSIYDELKVRNSLYGFSIASSELERGDSYLNYKKLIQINLDISNNFKEPISEFKMYDIRTKELENDLIISYHVDLSRIIQYNDNNMKLFQIFGDNIDNLKGIDKDMDDAINELERISNDEHIIGLYDAEKVERKMRNTELMCARNEGIQEGIEEGKKETLIASIKRMKAKGLDDNAICELLDLNLDKLKKLLENQ